MRQRAAAFIFFELGNFRHKTDDVSTLVEIYAPRERMRSDYFSSTFRDYYFRDRLDICIFESLKIFFSLSKLKE